MTHTESELKECDHTYGRTDGYGGSTCAKCGHYWDPRDTNSISVKRMDDREDWERVREYLKSIRRTSMDNCGCDYYAEAALELIDSKLKTFPIGNKTAKNDEN